MIPDLISRLLLINEIEKRDIDYQKIERLIRSDFHIRYKLLNHVNSAKNLRRFPISSVKDAITFTGEHKLKKIIHEALVSGIGSDYHTALIRHSVIRGRILKKFGRMPETGFSPPQLFTLGLFSLADDLSGLEMKEVLARTDFPQTVKNALLGRNRAFNRLMDTLAGYSNPHNSGSQMNTGTAEPPRLHNCNA